MKFEAGTPNEAWDQGVAAVVCHDAGAASHAFAWLTSDPSRQARVYAEGPAARLAHSRGLRVEDDLEGVLASADWALVGTGWQSELERQAMRICAASGVPCLAIVDHWVNYSERFHGVEVEERPRQVVVTDTAAERLARQQLPWSTVVRWPNDQATAFVRDVHQYRERGIDGAPYLLWIQEPIREADGRVRDPLGDFDFASLLWRLIAAAAQTASLDRVVVRMHPSQSVVPYYAATVGVEVRNSHESPLAYDVGGAEMCLGINSYALYMAATAGVKSATVAAAVGLPSLIPGGLVPAFL